MTQVFRQEADGCSPVQENSSVLTHEVLLPCSQCGLSSSEPISKQL